MSRYAGLFVRPGWLLLGWLLLGMGSAAAQSRGGEMLDETAYRTGLEEIIIRGEAPRWRHQPAVEPLRPEDIDFSEPVSEPRLDWLSTYTRDERDKYQGVRDRKNETPELKLFEIHF